MKMTAERRAIDKIFKRRDRYEIPDWQREKVWDPARKRCLIDSILRGWKLPKFYFVKTSADGFEVVDGQQRLSAIFEFCSNDLTLSPESAKKFGASRYRDLRQPIADAFDDFEIEYDVIEDASEQEQKEFFQRVQAGLPLTSSEKVNAIHSKLRDFCRKASRHPFFSKTVPIPNTRYAHFDIAAKVATIEIEGLQTGLRFDEIKAVFEAHENFSATSAVAKKIQKALDLLHSAFRNHGDTLRTRTVVQSLVTLACKIVGAGRSQDKGVGAEIRKFFEAFQADLGKQIEMGQAATDSDYLTFQQSVNANVKGGAKTRHQILLRQLFRLSPSLADLFDPSVVAESGVSGRISALGDSIAQLVPQLNEKYAAAKGEDLFKATNKTAQALIGIKKAVRGLPDYGKLIDNLYFLFRESAGTRLGEPWPTSFADVNDLRTYLRHDVDHGTPNKVRSKRRKIGAAFAKYAGGGTPDTIDPAKLPLVQSNLLSAIEGDLRALATKSP